RPSRASVGRAPGAVGCRSETGAILQPRRGGESMQASSSSAVPGNLSTAPKAGFWIRFVAIFIDAIIVGVVTTIIGAILNLNTNGRSGVQLLLGLVYYVYFWSNSSPWPGQTLGSKLLNTRVIRTNRSALSIC